MLSSQHSLTLVVIVRTPRNKCVYSKNDTLALDGIIITFFVGTSFRYHAILKLVQMFGLRLCTSSVPGSGAGWPATASMKSSSFPNNTRSCRNITRYNKPTRGSEQFRQNSPKHDARLRHVCRRTRLGK